MNEELKTKLLTRKFSSTNYMEELLLNFSRCLHALEVCIEDWYQHCEGVVDTSQWNPADTVQAWEQRALPNYKSLKLGIEEGIRNFKNGDNNRILGVSNGIMNLTRNTDVLGNKWWHEIDQELARKQGQAETQAEQIASNIWYTIGEYFDPGEILNEKITGPIDENELLNYLLPGESANG